VVGGLLVSQTLTLYVTPVAYIYLDRLQQRLAGHRRVEQDEKRPSDVPRDEHEELITVGRG
jgi:HAE1 family hydrophobic/amphiphilic exporter-1